MNSPTSLTVETLTGAAIVPHLPALARLRITVFREFPYLYDGDEAYEERYLRTYVEAPLAAVVIARDGAEIVGASTCLPLSAETENVTAPFRARGLDLSRFFYFGESVLLKAYRGRGIGVAFFEHREAQARRAGADYATFCAVIRAPDDPRRPPDYVPLDAFWRHRGYTHYPDFVCTMRWKEVGAAEETDHHLSFWMKSLSGAPLP